MWNKPKWPIAAGFMVKKRSKTIDHRRRFHINLHFYLIFSFKISIWIFTVWWNYHNLWLWRCSFYWRTQKIKNILIDQIDNPVYLNLEIPIFFIKKRKEALQTLLSLKKAQTKFRPDYLSTFYILQN
jgi:hypothetical protein